MGIFGWNTDKKEAAQEWIEKGKKARDPEEKIRCFDRALKADPESVRAWHNKGQTLDYAGNFTEALTCYDRALELQQGNPYIWNSRGNILRKLGKFPEALHCYDRAIALKKDYPYPWNGKGDTLLDLGQTALAGKCYDQALKRKEIAWAWNGKGRVFLSFHDEKKAVNCFDRAIGLKPAFVWAWLGKGNALCAQGRYTVGIACFATALKIQPDFQEARDAMAEAEGHKARTIDAQTPGRLLLSALSDDMPDLRMRAAQEISGRAKRGAACEIVREGGIEALLRCADTDSPEVKKYLMWAFGDLADNGFAVEIAESGVPLVIVRGLDNPSHRVRSAAAWAIAVLAWNRSASPFIDGGAVPLLVQRLKDRHDEVREYAALALDKITYFGDVEPLIQAQAVPALLSCLYDPSTNVQNRALWALWSVSVRGESQEMLDAGATRPLVCCLQSTDSDIRRAALCTVGECIAGSRACAYSWDEEIGLVIDSLWSRSASVRAAAAWALGQCAHTRPDLAYPLTEVRQGVEAMVGDRTAYPVYNHTTEAWETRNLDAIAREVLDYLLEEHPNPAIPPDFPDALISRYSATEPLGRGGFACVFRARRWDGTDVAIKVPFHFDDATGASFIAEIQNWTRLCHPNIVQVLDYNIMPVPYFELELCDLSLDEVPVPMDPAQAVAIVFEICEGLKYAHGQAIAHLDLKPRNVLLKGGVPKISDWGHSKVLNGQQVLKRGSFTAGYAAPEQVEGREETEATDIWQIGVILYRLLTATLPFAGETVTEIEEQVLHRDPPPPSAANPATQGLDTPVMRCLEKDPARRYESVADLQRDLAAYLQTRYSHALDQSRHDGDVRDSAMYCGDLVLMNLRTGDSAAAYMYASDLVLYLKGDIQASARDLADQIRVRVENQIPAVPEEILKKAEFIVHRIHYGENDTF